MDRQAVTQQFRPAPVVSVVIIFLDGEATLREAVDSVVNQTFGDWEILLVDDGSGDGSATIALGYARRFPEKIKYLTHPGGKNLGMSASRNLGIANSRGRYLAFLDADDVYMPDRLDRHLRILEATPAIDMVQSELIHWYSWAPETERLDDDYVKPFLSVGNRVLEPPEGLLMGLLVPIYSTGICNVTLRRSAVMSVGGFESEFRGMYEDQVFLAKIYLSSRVYVLQAYLARYRRHPQSFVRRAKESAGYVDGGANADTVRFREWMVRHIESSDVRHPVLLEECARLRAGLQAKAAAAPAPIAGFVAAIRGLLQAALPVVVYRRLLRLNRAREFRRAQLQYQQLCQRLTEASGWRLTSQEAVEASQAGGA